MQDASGSSPDSNSGTPTYHLNGGSALTSTRNVLFDNYAVNDEVLVTVLSIAFSTHTHWNDELSICSYSTDTFTAASKVKEFIIYNSDKTSIRSGIEGNINSYYSIY